MKRLTVFILVVALTLGVATSALASGFRRVCYSRQSTNICPFWGHYYNAMRFQTYIEQRLIRYYGAINEVEFYKSTSASGRFYNYRVYLCHTRRTSLSTTFANNYYGSRILVASRTYFAPPARTGWFGLLMTRRFTYNNRDGLLIEVQWRTDTGVSVPIYTTNPLTGNRRIWATSSPTAPTGRGDGRAYYTRLNFNYYTGAEPTSLGRVKAMYQ